MSINNRFRYTVIRICCLIIVVILPIVKTSAQSIENIRTTANHEQVIVDYDLVGGLQSTMNIQMRVKINDATTVNPVNISGDIKAVLPGRNKRIIWDALREVGELDVEIAVELNIQHFNLRERECLRLSLLIDSFYQANELDEAVRYLNMAEKCSEKFIAARATLKEIEMKISRQQIKATQEKADAYLLMGAYELALDLYKSIVKSDPDEIYLEKIKQIETQKIVFEKRHNTIFNYAQTNQADFKRFKTHMAQVIDAEILLKSKGSLRFNYLIEYDTLGRNKSGFNQLSTSIRGFDARLKNADFTGILAPSQKQGYFLASRESLSVYANWTTNREKYHYDFRGIHSGAASASKLQVMDSFIRRQPAKYGDYYFDIKHKKFNDQSFFDVRLSKYRVRGPSNAIYSLAIPGLGSMRVSYGEAGIGRLAGFFSFTALSVGAKIFSDRQYHKYMQATEQAEMEDLYMQSNVANKVFLISGGMAATFYLYDFIWAFNRGVKNLSDTRELRRKIRAKDYYIHKSSIIW